MRTSRAIHRRRLETEAITHKQRLRQGHRVNRALDAIAANAKRLRATYADADRARAEELASFGTLDTNSVASDPNDDPETIARETRRRGQRRSRRFTAGSKRRARTTRRAGHVRASSGRVHAHVRVGRPFDVFAEESNGRFPRLARAPRGVQRALRRPLRSVRRAFGGRRRPQMRAIPRARKFGDAYSAYLESLRAYLAGFLEKVAPLRFSGREREGADDEEKVFDEAWRAGNVSGGRTEAFLVSGTRRLNTRTAGQ